MACNDRNMKGGGGRARRSLTGAILVLDLLEDAVIETTSVGPSNWDDHVLTGADFEDLGPGIDEIVIHAEGSNFTTGFTYRAILQYKFKNGPWQDDANPVILLPAQTNGDYVIGTAFTDRTKLGMKIRIVLQTQVDSAQTGTKKGNLTFSAAVRLRCCG